jgi:hypothetical protein
MATLETAFLQDQLEDRKRLLQAAISVALPNADLAGLLHEVDSALARMAEGSFGLCSIIGHGRRRKQAHDQHQDWIGIRRGRCPGCGTTFTFLPLLSLPYTHYSLLAHAQTLRRRLVEHCSWEQAAPMFKDPNQVPDPSTLRWSRGLDTSQPALSFLRKTLVRMTQWVRGVRVDHHAQLLSWLTPVCQVLWPLRL